MSRRSGGGLKPSPEVIFELALTLAQYYIVVHFCASACGRGHLGCEVIDQMIVKGFTPSSIASN